MAQTSSAAREPSMEEILASIRRIIEDSDITHQSGPLASASGGGAVAEFRRPAVEQPLSQPGGPEKSAMVGNVFQERPALRGSIEEPMQAVPTSEAEAEDDVVLKAENDDHSQMKPESSAKEQTKAKISLEEIDLSVEKDISETVDALLSSETGVKLEQPTGDHEGSVLPDAAEPVMEPVVNTQPAAHILSQVTERQVAAAFQDLNHAVRAEPRRSFDDIATELLRPMLQDWLDNNLPTLVERLVREEIERVVRGER